MGEACTRGAGDLGNRVDREIEDRLKVLMHEIRQPVAVVLALAEAARGLPGTPDQTHEYLDRIVDQVQEVSAAAFSVLIDDDPGEWEPLDLEEVLSSVLDAYTVTWAGTLYRSGPRGALWTAGCRATIRRCVVNVLDNAARAAGPAGRVVVTTVPGEDAIRVVVEDDGPGFGRGPSGSGIGLPATQRTLRLHGGRITIDRSRALSGARVTLSLPNVGPVGEQAAQADLDRVTGRAS